MNQVSKSHLQEDSSEAFDPGKDQFTLQLINRKVRQLLCRPGFHERDRADLKQQFLARVVQSLESFNPKVGHRYPFITTVVERYVANVIASLNSEKNCSGKVASLNVTINIKDAGPTELIQTIGNREIDRRLGRERVLSEEQLNDLRLDLSKVIAVLPKQWQELLERCKTQNPAEISREMGIPRTTLRDWLQEIRVHFEEAGLAEYFQK